MLIMRCRTTNAKTTRYKGTMNPGREDSSEMELDTKVSMGLRHRFTEGITNLDWVVCPFLYYTSGIYQRLDGSCVNVRPRYISINTQPKIELQNLHSRKVKNDGVQNRLLHIALLFRLASTSPACVIPWPISSFDVGHVLAASHVFFDMINQNRLNNR